jgi:hypothetical protein
MEQQVLPKLTKNCTSLHGVMSLRMLIIFNVLRPRVRHCYFYKFQSYVTVSRDFFKVTETSAKFLAFYEIHEENKQLQ